jgi:FkbM family methyltransferase
MSFLVHYLRQDDVFVDVGANIGAYTVLAAAAAGARTYAFEPSPAAVHSLRDNLALDHISGR